ncbi:type VI secretion system baseplate subunit TssF [Aquitalea magnusonii]|uniref:Type VI secretion system protein ImpG n=1 Tax=Aquitalea magnusonii TaxID=332411 RepID=A0A318JIN0_9NEIS|nr:type VI secretion system baseplate subunit TssF [Aquitalea magnusonii]PXX48820.1 type VI secretion system protein ImpG [Aquitalea magnusonii]
MDDQTLHYFEAEMRYLRDAGKEFAQAHPDRAAQLNLDRVGDLDPMVERLLEGFAFLMGKLQQKLDDDLPELTENLVSLLWPHYLRMIPSLTVMSFQPATGVLQQAEHLASGTAVQSDPVGTAGIRCHYRTTRPLQLLPLQLQRAQLEEQDDGRQLIRLGFLLEAQANRESLDLSRLPLFLNADAPVAFALLHALTRPQVRLTLKPSGQETVIATDLSLRQTGFDPDDALWPRPATAHGGYPLLMEYFAFREKFLFIELQGIQTSQLPTDGRFDIEISLGSSFPPGLPFDQRAFQLNCVPAINLFEVETEPIHVDHLSTEYRVIPRLQDAAHVEVFSVDSVQAFDHHTGQRHAYLPFSSFRHRGGMLRHEAPERYYHSSQRQSASGRYDTWLMLGGHAWHQQNSLFSETLSLQVTGTNGMLPRKALRQTQLLTLLQDNPSVVAICNLLPPSLPCHPPREDRFQWRVLSHMASNYLSLLNTETLRGTLALYDWTHDELNRRRLQAIVDVSHQLVRKVERGCVMSGVEITITLDQAGFTGEGDLYLFATLLDHFLAGYADLNLFTRLRVLLQPTGQIFCGEDRACSRPPL